MLTGRGIRIIKAAKVFIILCLRIAVEMQGAESECHASDLLNYIYVFLIFVKKYYLETKLL